MHTSLTLAHTCFQHARDCTCSAQSQYACKHTHTDTWEQEHWKLAFHMMPCCVYLPACPTLGRISSTLRPRVTLRSLYCAAMSSTTATTSCQRSGATLRKWALTQKVLCSTPEPGIDASLHACTVHAVIKMQLVSKLASTIHASRS